MKIIGYFVTLGLVVVGCSSAPSTDGTDQTDEEIKSGMYACKTDSDCVAISKGGCCPNGWNVAVNKQHVKAYEASHVCHEQIVCPLYVILDQRVAECNVTKSKCEMVQPEDIRCGGFTANPHTCPKGWVCDYSGHVPDIPGNCVQK